MKQPFLVILLVIIDAAATCGQGLNPPEGEKLLQLVKELQAIQAQVADNQSKIDIKIADIAEAIRVAKIEASRGGGKHIPPPKK